MVVVNKVSLPGSIRRVELTSDVVRVSYYDGTCRVYKLDSVSSPRTPVQSGDIRR